MDSEYILKVELTRPADVGMRERKATRITNSQCREDPGRPGSEVCLWFC